MSFIRVLIPFMRALPLEPSHPQRLHLLISYWRLEVQYMYFGEHKHSVYSSVFFKIWRIIALQLCLCFGCIQYESATVVVQSLSHVRLCDPMNYSTPGSSVLELMIAVSRLFASGGQSIGASASASVLPMNIQG